MLIPLYWVLITSFKIADRRRQRPLLPALRRLPAVARTPGTSCWSRTTRSGPTSTRSWSRSTSTVLAVLIGSLAAYALVRIRFQVKLAAVAIFVLLLVARHRRRRAASACPGSSRSVVGARALPALRSARIGRRFRPRARQQRHRVLDHLEPDHAADRRGAADLRDVPAAAAARHPLALIATYTAVNLPIVVWLTRDFFAGIPIDLEESAEIDGASKFRVFFTIALPLVRSGPGRDLPAGADPRLERVPAGALPLQRQRPDHAGAGLGAEHARAGRNGGTCRC